MTDETCLLQWGVHFDRLVISRLELDCLSQDDPVNTGVNINWRAPPDGEIVVHKGYEAVIRNEGGVIKLLHRKVSETENPA